MIQMGEYSTTAPTLSTDKSYGNVQIDTRSNIKTTLGTLIAGEDLTNDILKVEERYSYSGIKTADAQIKASAGFIHSINISCNDAAPTAGSIIVYDNTAESGTQVWNETFTATAFRGYSIILDVVCSTGIYVGFTTTADVNVQISYR